MGNAAWLFLCAGRVNHHRTKFVDDRWMSSEGFIDAEVPPQAAWWWNQPLSVLQLQTPITVSDHVSILVWG